MLAARHMWRAAAFLGMVGAVLPGASAAAPNDFWSSAFANGPNGPVLSLAVFEDDLYAGGSFDQVGGIAANNIARWDGASWHALGSGVDDVVHALYVFDGELWIGGEFTQAGPFAASRVARWNGSSFGTVGDGFDGPVYALGEFGGLAVATGAFTASGTNPTSNVARWFGFTWVGMSTGFSNLGRALHLHGDGNLYAGGAFFSAGGNPVSSVASWNGNDWGELGGGVSGGFQNQPFVEGLTSFDGDLIVGGRFDMAGTIQSAYIARWTGSSWLQLGAGIGASPAVPASSAGVYALAVFRDELIVAGHFDSAGGNPAANVASWNGATWDSLGSGLDDAAFAAADFNDALFVGGSFSQAGPFASQAIAKWEPPTPTHVGDNAPSGLTLLLLTNPTRNRLRVAYDTQRSGHVRLSLFDARGRRLAVLMDRAVEAGVHQTTWPASSLASGLYIVVLETPGSIVSRKLVVSH